MKLYRPFRPWHVTQKWGEIPIDPKTGLSRYAPYGFTRHNGVDAVALEIGNPPKTRSHWPIFSPGEDLRVFNVQDSPGGGKEVYLISNNEMDLPTGRGYLGIVFMHNDTIFVKAGQQLSIGQLLCISDNSGENTSGEHSHMGTYRVNKYWQKLDKNDAAGSFDLELMLSDVYVGDIASTSTLITSMLRYYQYVLTGV